VVDKTFLNAKDAPDLSFATLIEPSGDITARVLAALPKPDVALDRPWQRLTYTHRSWRDAEMYFFFNESDKEESRIATIAGRGQAQAWDLATGEIHPISGAAGPRAIPCAFRWCSNPTRRRSSWSGRCPPASPTRSPRWRPPPPWPSWAATGRWT